MSFESQLIINTLSFFLVSVLVSDEPISRNNLQVIYVNLISFILLSLYTTAPGNPSKSKGQLSSVSSKKIRKLKDKKQTMVSITDCNCCILMVSLFYLTFFLKIFNYFSLYFTGARQEQDIFVRLIDSVTKQVSIDIF